MITLYHIPQELYFYDFKVGQTLYDGPKWRRNCVYLILSFSFYTRYSWSISDSSVGMLQVESYISEPIKYVYS